MKYLAPKSLDELVILANKHGSEAAIIAGCTDVLVKNDFLNNKKVLIDTTSVKEIKHIEDLGNKIRIGGGVTFSNLKDSDLIIKNSKVLLGAVKVCGSLQIRNRATIAGNIVNASPAADSIPPLMVSNAQLILLSEDGEESVDIRKFFAGPGKTIIKPNQVLAFIEFEKDQTKTISFYRKIGTRQALSIAKASVAFKALKTNGKLHDVQIAYGSVGPTVIYSQQAKDYLENKQLTSESIEEVSLKAFEEVSPISDIRSTATYRKLVIKNILIEELQEFI